MKLHELTDLAHKVWGDRPGDETPFFADLERFAALVAAAERAEVERLRALCEEMLSELFVYRASENLKDVTAAIRARGKE
jgi:hypothetical protein